MSTFRSDMERQAFDRIKGRDEFHWSDLAASGVNHGTAGEFVRRWEAAGLIRCIRKDKHRKIYAPADRPALVPEDPTAARTPEGNMWRTMRQLGGFTPTDVAAHSNAGGIEVTVAQARNYCRLLLAANYLRVAQTAIHGKREAIYRLVANSGPAAPHRRRVSGVFDPNTGTFIPEGAPK